MDYMKTHAKMLAISSILLIAGAGLSFVGGVRYNPLLLYTVSVALIAWNATMWWVIWFTAISVFCLLTSAIVDTRFYYDLVPFVDLTTRMVTIAVVAYSVSRLRAVTDELLKSQRNQLEEKIAHSEYQKAFITALSHEIRTPLNIISGHAQRLMATEEPYTGPQIIERCTTIKSSVMKIQKILESILLSERLNQSGLLFRPEIIDIEGLLDALARKMRQGNPNAAFVVEPHGHPLLMFADGFLIEHVLSNIVGNALKYSRKPLWVRIAWARVGDDLIITVADRGIGIPERDLSQVFIKNFRGSNVGETTGFGLGLFLVHHIIDLHGGKIDVESTLGIGTRITITLPITLP